MQNGIPKSCFLVVDFSTVFASYGRMNVYLVNLYNCRPPKPPHLAALPPPPSQNEGHASTSGQERPAQPGHNPQNYANSKEMQELCLNEQNNNRGRPEVTRVHKPGRNSNFMQAGMSLTLGPPSSVPRDSAPSHSATLGPPVKRNLKPKSPGENFGFYNMHHATHVRYFRLELVFI